MAQPKTALRLVCALGLATATWCVSSQAASAQEKTRNGTNNGAGMDTHLYRSAFDSKGFFATNGADILGANQISFGLVLDYGYNLLPLNSGHGDASQLIQHSLQGTLDFNYGIANWLVVGISAPITLAISKEADDVGPTGHTYNIKSMASQGLSYVGLHAKLRLIRPGQKPSFGLAVIAQGGVAAIGADDLTAEPKGFVWPELALEGRLLKEGNIRLGLNAGFRAHFGDPTSFGLGADGQPELEHGILENGDVMTGSFAASARILAPFELVAETYGTYLVGGASDKEERFSAEAVGGIKLFIDNKSHLMLAGGGGYAPGFQTATARGIVGFMYEPSIGDRDGDGIPDDEDDCPDQPEDFDGFQDTKADSPKGQYGCPDPDNDNDGVLDEDDQCPNTPGPASNHGCPVVTDGDRDHDGVLDSKDKCPDTPGLPEFQGCPDPDRDHDGVPDAQDKCPDLYGPASNQGCPEEPKPDPDKRVIVSNNSILILDKIQFETGSSKILAASNSILDAVASTLKDNPEFTLIEVQGHADERGSDALNVQLTNSRAKSVSDAIVQRGIARDRLRSQGYSSYCPLDDESNAAAWEKNRRVEFKIVRSKEGPTGVELGCPKAVEKGIKPQP